MKIQKLGRYEIVSELGHGAMGTVYKAVDPLIERTVAIKTINLDLSKEDLAVFEDRFYREAKSAGKLTHPNIVTIYDVGESDNIAYIAMEFLEGQSLRDILDSGAVLPLERIVKIAVQVADGLAYAQEHGIVHRDIKPANIVITKSGTAKITDFGIAHMPTGSRTMAGTVLGSPKYMSPEQIIGKQVDGRSDVFSLGVVLYEMLTGTSPFDGDNISTIMYRILNEMPAPPHALNASIPLSFDWMLAKALAKHPDDRYQSASEFAREIRRYRQAEKPSGALAAHGTLERRKKPRTEGDTTMLLRRMTDGGLTQTSTPEPLPTPAVATQDKPRPVGRMKHFLYGGIAILLAAFAATLYLGKDAVEEPAPVQATSPAAPVAVPSTSPASTQASVPPSLPEPAQPAQPTTTEPPAAADEATHAVPPKNTGKPHISVEPKPIIGTEVPTSAKSASLIPKGKESTGDATLLFAIAPWGEVYVDGKAVGIAPPLKELKLASGKHRIEIQNQGSQPYVQTLDIAPGATAKIKHKFK